MSSAPHSAAAARRRIIARPRADRRALPPAASPGPRRYRGQYSDSAPRDGPVAQPRSSCGGLSITRSSALTPESTSTMVPKLRPTRTERISTLLPGPSTAICKPSDWNSNALAGICTTLVSAGRSKLTSANVPGHSLPSWFAATSSTSTVRLSRLIALEVVSTVAENVRSGYCGSASFAVMPTAIRAEKACGTRT